MAVEVGGPVAREPGERFVARRVQHDPPVSRKRTRSQTSSGPAGRCSERTTATPRPAASRTKGVRSLGIELGGRLVEQEQLRLEGERGRQADPLQLAGGELRDAPLEQMLGPERGEGGAHPRRDLGGRRADVLDAEGDLVPDTAEDHLVLRILEDGRDEAGEVGRPRPASVVPADLHASLEPAAVEVRHEPGQGAHERRLARARGAEDGDDLAGTELERQRPGAPAPGRDRQNESPRDGR